MQKIHSSNKSPSKESMKLYSINELSHASRSKNIKNSHSPHDTIQLDGKVLELSNSNKHLKSFEPAVLNPIEVTQSHQQQKDDTQMKSLNQQIKFYNKMQHRVH